MTKQDAVKEIKKVSLSDDDFLVVTLPEHISDIDAADIRDYLNKFLGAKFHRRILIFIGDVEFTKITKEVDSQADSD